MPMDGDIKTHPAVTFNSKFFGLLCYGLSPHWNWGTKRKRFLSYCNSMLSKIGHNGTDSI
jgi:hypothetical protein